MKFSPLGFALMVAAFFAPLSRAEMLAHLKTHPALD